MLMEDSCSSSLRLRVKSGSVTADANPISVTKTEAKFDIVIDERVKLEQAPASSKWSNLIPIISFWNLVFYLSALFLNIFAAWAQGQELSVLIVPLVFAISQVFENFSQFTEAIWHAIVFVNKQDFVRPVLQLRGSVVPAVVMVIVTCGEPQEIIMDTVRAAVHVDYPHDKLRIIVADDGDSASLRREVTDLQANHSFLHYTSRSGGKGYKAGNLNTCLRSFVPSIGFKFDWICVLDADMIPAFGILRSLLPHALEKDDIGMVTTGQHFYNIPDNDPLYQSNITGTHAEDGARDSCGTAWCPGSGFVMRSQAWLDIGGFPEYAVTEDLFTSWHLHGMGWKTLLVHEILQWGVQPDCFVVHMKQRRRWWTGHLSRVLTTGMSLFDDKLKKANFVQRAAMFQHCLRPFNNTVFKAISLMLITLCVATGQKVLATPGKGCVLSIFISLSIRSLIARHSEFKDFPDLDKIWNMRRRHATNTWLGLHFAIDTVKAVMSTFFPGRLDIQPLGFEVSGVKERREDSAHERNASRRLGCWKRVLLLHRKEGILFHPGVAAIITVLMVYQLVRIGKTSDTFWYDVICSVGYPGLGLIELVPLEFTALGYAVFPPTMPARRELMQIDKDRNIYLPKEDSKKMRWIAKTSVWLAIPHLVAFVWLIFALSKMPWRGVPTIQGIVVK